MGDLDGCLFLPGDQPLLRAASIAREVRLFQADPTAVIRLACGSRAGSPQSLFAALGALRGEQGGSAVLRPEAGFAGRIRCIEVEAEHELEDIDTPDDLEALVKVYREAR